MTTNQAESPRTNVAAPPPPKPRPQTSPVRLVVLLGLLAVVIGAYGYDYFVAKPQCDATDEKIQKFVDAQNKLGVKEASLVTPDAIHKELGMMPTKREVHADKDYEIEYYCFWGPVPVLNMRRHFISIVYVGKEPRHFSSHHRERPPEEALPITSEPDKADGITLGQPENAGGKDGDAPSKTDEGAAADAPAAGDAKKPDTEEGKTGKDGP